MKQETLLSSIKPGYPHILVDKELGALSPISRSERTELAISYACSVNDAAWVNAYHYCVTLPKTGSLSVPSSIQLSLSEEANKNFEILLTKVSTIFKEKCILKSLRRNFMILMIWALYLEFMRKESAKAQQQSNPQENQTAPPISDADTMKAIIDIIFTPEHERTKGDTEILSEIKKIISRVDSSRYTCK